MSRDTIFVSYRRSDSRREVLRLVERLRTAGKEIFLDTSSIQVADRFPRKLERALNEANVVIVVIGRGWLGTTDETGERRLDDPDDFVRREVALALERKDEDVFVDIVPVLLPGAKMPRAADLPEGIEGLAEISAMQLEKDRFDESVDELSRTIDGLLAQHGQRADSELDAIDDYLSAKDVELQDVASLSPTSARNPDLHDLPRAAEWICTRDGAFELRFETFDDLYFEGRLVMPQDLEVEGSWSLQPGTDETLVMQLSGKTTTGAAFNVSFPIQEKVGRRSYGGYDVNGQYYRLRCVRRTDREGRRF